MKRSITFAALEREVRELALSRPHFIYPHAPARGGIRNYSCSYNGREDYGQPPCIFGQAFINLGLPVPANMEGDPIDTVIYELLVDGKDLSDPDTNWASTLQARQDVGDPWKDALMRADVKRENRREAVERLLQAVTATRSVPVGVIPAQRSASK